MRLIDADALKAVLEDVQGYVHIEEFFEYMNDMPMLNLQKTIDEAYSNGYRDGTLDAEHERPQGKWMKTALYGQTCYECDNCHLHYDYESNFCSNCGAQMKGEEK